MVKDSWLSLAFTGLVFLLIGCSSLKKKALDIYLKNIQDERAEGLVFEPPPQPYVKQNHAVLDALWWNSQSGSSISYFSSCSRLKRTLKKFQADSFPRDSKYRIIEQSQSLGSLYSVLEIFENSKKIYSGIYTIQKGKCLFNINLVSSSFSSFKKEKIVFRKFIKSFKNQ